MPGGFVCAKSDAQCSAGTTQAGHAIGRCFVGRCFVGKMKKVASMIDVARGKPE